MSIPLLDRTVRKAFSALCWNVGTPVAYRALIALENDDWGTLTAMKVAPRGYTCPRTLSGDLQIASFFKKYQGFNLGFDLKTLAAETFQRSERDCYKANERISPLIFDHNHYGRELGNVVKRIRGVVRDILGPAPSYDKLDPRFGPGSTYLDVGPLITVPDKMSDDYTLTPDARPLLEAWDKTAWSRYAAANLTAAVSNSDIAEACLSPDFSSPFAVRSELFVRGNRFTTVPKDARRLRGICIEPSINLFYQLGVGKWIEKRMGRKIGWHKSNQQELHRFLAQLGSLTGDSATIDLANASDTVCINLVKLLLPSDWFKLLDCLRSKHTFIGGHWQRLEKFSSMGNGFTFELETLLFYSIASVMSDGTSVSSMWRGDKVSVFGDDIICPSDKAKDVIAALKFLGLSVNVGKTFVDGEFRESCGGDFYRGLNVRPHYLKESPDEPHQLIALANGLRRFGIRHILCGGPDVYRFPWIHILKQIPNRIRACRGPEHLGDQVIHDDEDRWETTVRSSIRYFRVWRPIPFIRTGWHHFRPGVVLASALYGCGDGCNRREPSTGKSVIDPGGVLSSVDGKYVSGYRFGRVSYS